MKKNKAIIGSDFHVRPSHLHTAERLLKKVLAELKEKKPEYYINLGDTFHTKNMTYVSATKTYKDFLLEVSKLGIKTIQLVGNHDWADPYYQFHALESLKNLHENITIVEDFFKLGDNVFISYCREKERFAKFLAEAGKAKRIFAHMDMNGFTPGSGWEEISPFFDAEYFENYEMVVSGHLHLAQEKTLKKSGTQIIFVGSGYTTDFGESDQEKRLLWFDLETGDWESISTGLTLHKTLRFTAKDPIPKIPQKDIDNGVEYRVIFSGTKEEYSLLDIPKKYPASIVPEFLSKGKTRIDLSVTETKDETMTKYIQEELKRSYGGVEESGYDVEKLLHFGKRFLPKG